MALLRKKTYISNMTGSRKRKIDVKGEFEIPTPPPPTKVTRNSIKLSRVSKPRSQATPYEESLACGDLKLNETDDSQALVTYDPMPKIDDSHQIQKFDIFKELNKQNGIEDQDELICTKWVKKIGTGHAAKVQCPHCREDVTSESDMWTHNESCYRKLLSNKMSDPYLVGETYEWETRSHAFRFACTFCKDGNFDLLYDLRVHLRDHYPDEAAYQCLACQQKFNTIAETNNHLIEKHKIDPFNQDRRMSYAGAVMKLEQEHLNERKIDAFLRKKSKKSEKADVRDKFALALIPRPKFEDPDYIVPPRMGFLNEEDDDIQFNEPPGGFRCPLDSNCIYGPFHEEKYAVVHSPCFQPLYDGRREVWDCREGCHKVFKTKFLLIQHVASHLERRWECRICHLKFSSLGQARTHSAAHQRNKAHPCEICNLPFVSTMSLNRHNKREHRSGSLNSDLSDLEY